tara:strand:+ start:310 stop:519 length:210 start_codon:yes stop_codon:yes gene_type:complete
VFSSRIVPFICEKRLEIEKKENKINVCFKNNSLRWYYPDQVKGFVLSHLIWIKVAPLTIKITNIDLLKK